MWGTVEEQEAGSVWSTDKPIWSCSVWCWNMRIVWPMIMCGWFWWGCTSVSTNLSWIPTQHKSDNLSFKHLSWRMFEHSNPPGQRLLCTPHHPVGTLSSFVLPEEPSSGGCRSRDSQWSFSKHNWIHPTFYFSIVVLYTRTLCSSLGSQKLRLHLALSPHSLILPHLG